MNLCPDNNDVINDLLAALERIVKIAECRIAVQPYTFRDIARNAIAKARGKGNS